MNKKFLSVILFSALMVGSAGTFTSCKDYDDDIDQINKELTDIRSIITDLQGKIGDGKFVTNVEKGADGLVITWNDKTTNTIAFDKEQGGNFPEITIDPATGNWLVDGEDTGFSAKGDKGDNGVNAKSPSIDPKTGNWVVYEWDAEKQEYVPTDTGISAKGASTYVVDQENYYELHVATDETGANTTVIKLPKTPTTITEIEVLGQIEKQADGSYNLTDWTKGAVAYNYSILGEVNAGAYKKWNDEKKGKTLKKGQVLSTLSNGNVLVRVAPAALNASKFEFSLVNSMLKEAPVTLGTPVAFEGLLTRAANDNGLWSIALSANEDETYKDGNAYEANFTVGNKAIAFALKEKEGFVTNYDLTFAKNTQIDLTAKVKSVNETAYADENTAILVPLNELNTVYFDKLNNVYDAHLDIPEATILRWGITDINGTSFKVTKLADEITTADFNITVHYVTLKGDVKEETIKIKPSKALYNTTVLDAHRFVISATAAQNQKDFALDKMFADLGANGTTLWKADVKKQTTEIFKVAKNGAESKITGLTATLDKSNDALAGISKVTVNVDDARIKKYDLEADASYYALITFMDEKSEVLNKVKVPFTLAIPEMDGLFVKQEGVFVGDVAHAYMDGEAIVNGKTIAATYLFKGAFENMAENLGSSTFTAALDDQTKIVSDSKSADLATLSTTSIDKTALADFSITLKDGNLNENGTQKGYGKELIVNFKNIKYLNVYEYKDAVYTFKIKVLSPILEGRVVAVGDEVTVPATKVDGYKVNDSHIKGYTYNEQVYSIFSDVAAPEYWKRKEIKEVAFASTNENIFTCNDHGSDFTMDGDKPVYGSVTVKPKNLKETTSADMQVVVTDAWGYKLTQKVKVTVTVGE